MRYKKRVIDLSITLCFLVGVTRLELATSRPPDAYSNQLSYTPFSKDTAKVELLFELCNTPA